MLGSAKDTVDLAPFTWLHSSVQRLTGILCVGLFGALCASSLALASGDAKARAEALLSSLKPTASDKQLTAAPIASARAALQRAADFEMAAKQGPARAAGATALELANLAKDILRASEVETAASKAEEDLKAARTELLRATALLEETEARRGRAQAELQKSAKPTGDAKPSEDRK